MGLLAITPQHMHTNVEAWFTPKKNVVQNSHVSTKNIQWENGKNI